MDQLRRELRIVLIRKLKIHIRPNKPNEKKDLKRPAL